MLAIIAIGLSIGFLGSFHCVGMCGPIALSLPILHENKGRRLLLIALYNLGRASTYALLGLLFGTIGNRFFLTGYQQFFSIAMGILVLTILAAGKVVNAEKYFFAGLHHKVQQLLKRFLFGKKNASHFYLIGIVNGLLPCGFVYLAIASAAAIGSATGGAMLMFAFGLGTMPLMFSIMVLGRAISFEIRKTMKKMMPFFIGITACLLVLRGMNLGIPFVSPAFESNGKHPVISCHK
jgi:sulfite exporter TauE/SafE